MNMNQNFELKRTDNKIELVGKFGMTEIHSFLAMVHQITTKFGYQDLVFDFSKITAAFPGPMVSVCSKALLLKEENIDIKLIPPENEKLQRLFVNTNWGYFICPNTFQPSTFRGYTHVPTIIFKDANEQTKAVNQILDATYLPSSGLSMKLPIMCLFIQNQKLEGCYSYPLLIQGKRELNM